jgi:hypothetical protein
MQTVIPIAVIVFLASILVFGLLSVLKDLLERNFVGSPLESEMTRDWIEENGAAVARSPLACPQASVTWASRFPVA